MVLEMYNKPLKIRLGALGKDHPDVATIYNNVGRACTSRKDSMTRRWGCSARL